MATQRVRIRPDPFALYQFSSQYNGPFVYRRAREASYPVSRIAGIAFAPSILGTPQASRIESRG